MINKENFNSSQKHTILIYMLVARHKEGRKREEYEKLEKTVSRQ